jgi:hypothetical protein
MNAEVYAAVIDGDVERALQATCQCLLRDQWKPLQETWVRLLSLCGERLYHSQQTPLFYHLVTELDTLLRQDDLPVKQALTMTTQLVVLFKRPFMKPRTANKATLQRLRSKVITYFPVDAQLTRSGKQKFQRFLPSDPEESAFAERIIVGLLQLCESQSPPEDLKDALEYLARKKLVLYTAPVLSLVVDAGNEPPPPQPPPEDLVGYLWMVLKVIKPLSFDEILERMYNYDYRSTYKNARLGYLYAMAFVSENSATSCAPIWNQTEHVLIQKVQENFLELWKEAKNANADHDADANAEAETYIDDRLELLSFVPTAPMRTSPIQAEPEPKAAPKKVAKVIHINKGKGRNRLIQRQENFKLNTEVDDDDEDEVRPIGERDARKRIQAMALNYIPMKNSLKEIPPRSMKPNASYRDSSGHRRIHFGEARPRIQNGDESEGSV